MTDGWMDATWDQVVEAMGRPVASSRCLGRGQLSVVGFLTQVTGRPALSPAERFDPEDRDWARTEVPSGDPETKRPVDLHCHRCRRSCGAWTARTIAARIEQGKARVP
jgi:hypothetical protein